MDVRLSAYSFASITLFLTVSISTFQGVLPVCVDDIGSLSSELVSLGGPTSELRLECLGLRDYRWWRSNSCQTSSFRVYEDCNNIQICAIPLSSLLEEFFIYFCCTRNNVFFLADIPEPPKCFQIKLCPEVTEFVVPPIVFLGSQEKVYISVQASPPPSAQHLRIFLENNNRTPRELDYKSVEERGIPNTTYIHIFEVPLDVPEGATITYEADLNLETCRGAYMRRMTQKILNDTDECAINNGGCEHTCINTIGSFSCHCHTGYRLDGNGLNCTDTDECATNNGGCEQLCNNTIGSFYCSCWTGYHLDGDGFNCSVSPTITPASCPSPTPTQTSVIIFTVLVVIIIIIAVLSSLCCICLIRYSIPKKKQHRNNHNTVDKPQIPMTTPLPMSLNPYPSNQPSLPSHPPLKQQTSIPDETLMTVLSCLTHRQNCQIPNCPCKSVQERYQELCHQHPSYHLHQHAAESCKRECGPNTDPEEQNFDLTLSSHNLNSDTDPICHDTLRPTLVQQRLRSVDLTPSQEFPPEFCSVAAEDAFYGDPTYDDYNIPLLGKISADNIPALCLNDRALDVPYWSSTDTKPHGRTNHETENQNHRGVREEANRMEIGVTQISSEADIDDINAVGSSAHSNNPPPFLEVHSRSCARSNPSSDEHETMSDDHGFCTNPSCPCQSERIRYLDKLMFGSQSKQHGIKEGTTASPLLKLEVVDYVDPPNSNVHFMDDIEVLHCDSNGGRYYNSVHDIHVEVPKGAVPKGMLVKLQVGVALFGAFLFPVGMKAVSPVVWLCTQPKQFMFHLPIEVKLPHCLQLTSLADITSLQLGFLRGGHNSDDKGNISFKYSGQAKFQPHNSYGIIRIKHFCYLCLTANYASPQFCLKTLFCLIRVVPRPIYFRTWDINFCVAMFLNTCIEAVKQQYPSSSFDVAAPVHFRFKPPEDGHPDPQHSICIKFEQNPTGEWMLAKKNDGELLANDVVDFEKDLETMKRMHDYKMYPPRFTIEVNGERATAPSRAKVEFTGVYRKLSTEVILPLPIQQLVQQKITEIPTVVPREIHQQPPTTPAAALNSEPELTDLMDKIAAKIPDQWMDIGIGLGLSVSELKCLPSQGLKPKDYFYHIFTVWKERMIVSYSWRKIIQVLKSPSVGQIRLATDLTAELRASVRHSYRYTSDGSTPRESESSDGSYSPQDYSVLRESIF